MKAFVEFLIFKSTKAFISADKTSNFYKLDKTQHDKLLQPPTLLTHKQNLLPKSSTSTTAQNKSQNNKLSLPQKTIKITSPTTLHAAP